MSRKNSITASIHHLHRLKNPVSVSNFGTDGKSKRFVVITIGDYPAEFSIFCDRKDRSAVRKIREALNKTLAFLEAPNSSEAGDVAASPVSRCDWKKAVSRFFRLKFRQFDLQLTILQLQVSNEILKLLVLRKQRSIASAKPPKRAAESPADHAPSQACDSRKRTDDTDGDSPLIKPNGN